MCSRARRRRHGAGRSASGAGGRARCGMIGAMCGIAGYVALHDGVQAPDLASLRDMAGAIRHRGPDEFGIYRDDAPASPTPACRSSTSRAASSRSPTRPARSGSSSTARSSTTSSCATELEALGHRFRTRSDTEVIVHAYEAVGRRRVPPLQRPVGDRALGSADAARWCWRAIRTASGRSTSASTAAACYFASEVKAIFAADAVDPARLRSGRASSRSSPSGRRCRRRRCSPASPSSSRARVRVYRRRHASPTARAWSRRTPATATDGFRGSLDDAVVAVRAALEQATSLRMLRADVPVGSYLSGGLDSSLVAALGLRAKGAQFYDVLAALRGRRVRRDGVPAPDGRATSAAITTRCVVSRDDIARVFPDVIAPHRAADPAHGAGAAVPAVEAGARRRHQGRADRRGRRRDVRRLRPVPRGQGAALLGPRSRSRRGVRG